MKNLIGLKICGPAYGPCFLMKTMMDEMKMISILFHHNHHDCHRKDKRGKVSGGRDLASTAFYPRGFCTKLFQIWALTLTADGLQLARDRVPVADMAVIEIMDDGDLANNGDEVVIISDGSSDED